MKSAALDQNSTSKRRKARSLSSGRSGVGSSRRTNINLNDTRSRSIFDLHPDIDDDIDASGDTDADADLPSLADASDYDDGSSGYGSASTSASGSSTSAPSETFRPLEHPTAKCRNGKDVGGTTKCSGTISRSVSTSSMSTCEDIIQPPQIRRTNNCQNGINASSPAPTVTISALKANGHSDKSVATSSCDSLFCISEFFSWDGDGKSKTISSQNLTKSKNPNLDRRGGENGAAHVNDDGLVQSQSQVEHQINTIRECIEVDLFQLMGCASDKICIRSNEITSSPSRHPCRGGTDDDDLLSTFMAVLRAQCPHDCDDVDSPQRGLNENGKSCQTNHCAMDDHSKFLNRGVYRREKARKRIQKLRESGLSRNFALVASFLEEERAEMGLLRRHPKRSQARRKHQESEAKEEDLERRRPALTCSKSLDFPIQYRQKGELSSFKNFASAEGTSDTFYRSSSCTLPMSSCGSGSGFGQEKNAIIACVPSVDSLDLEIELFYDSDPGSETSNVLTSYCLDEDTNSKSVKSTTSIGSSSDLNSNDTTNLLRSFDVDTFNMNDAAMVTQLIKELTNGHLSLISHPIPPNKKSGTMFSKSVPKNIPPLRTKAWFEMGSCLKTTLVQPKFIWRVYDPNIDTSRRKRIQTIKAPESVELLNIVRILAPGHIDRTIHPFAKANCTFKICTNSSEEYTFEAASEEERNRIVYAIKLVIARLASKIIVGDKDVFDEFFMTRSYRDKKERKWKEPSTSPTSAATSLTINDETSRDESMSRTGSICSTLVQPVADESGRQGELWGSNV